jgi:hypothetical protein
LQSRYYNPEWCRFLSADVFFDTGNGVLGTNMYAYCLNDCVNLKDSHGCNSSSSLAQTLGQTMALALMIGAAYGVVNQYAPGMGKLFENTLLTLAKNGSVNNTFGYLNSVIRLVQSGTPLFIGGTPVIGPPDSSTWVSKDVLRHFDSNGRATYDEDWGNEHPDLPSPHRHDWKWNGNNPVRGSAYAPNKMTLPVPAQSPALATDWNLGLKIFAGVALIGVLADDLTGAGVADDFLIPVLGGIILA